MRDIRLVVELAVASFGRPAPGIMPVVLLIDDTGAVRGAHLRRIMGATRRRWASGRGRDVGGGRA